MENGAFLGEDYFERLLEEIREIYGSASVDSIRKSPISMQPVLITTWMHRPPKLSLLKYRTSCILPSMGHTAAELIMKRADSKKLIWA
jgi:hypothetical protein